MKRPAIYAYCYVPRDVSNAEQIASCQQYAWRHRLEVPDYAILQDVSTPERRMHRSGLYLLKMFVQARFVDVILVADLSHISRDRKRLEAFLSHAKSHGVRVVGVLDEAARNEVA
jgi:DNA invertase Pin-like site-specific DNA recombinase